MRDKIRILFHDALLRNVLIASVAAVVVIPVYAVLYLYPSFENMSVIEAEDDAIRIASHVMAEIIPQDRDLSKDSLPYDLPNYMEKVRKDFDIVKIKIYMPSGEVIYSTNSGEIGRVNSEKYFHEAVAKGKSYAELIDEDDKSLEGQFFDADVVETYVPIMKQNRFMGAFEIYLNVTQRKRSIDNLIFRSYAVLFFIALGLLTAVIVTTFSTARNILSRGTVEAEVRRLNRELEMKVEERTRQLLGAREQLARKEKLAVLGQLAGTVAHELRNPLGVMSNAVYFLKTGLDGADNTTKEYLEIIGNEVGVSERIISGLLDFSRTKLPRMVETDLQELICLCLKKCSTPENVHLQISLPEKLRPVVVDLLQMEQVFHNLATNAFQAMPDGGTLRISGAVHESSPQDFVGVSFSDTGEGIQPENMERLFQPLFTTKAKGIGLGLIICKNLTEANGGRIEVESSPGKGTTFTVLLPLKENAGERERMERDQGLDSG